jgi:hypothetical protein
MVQEFLQSGALNLVYAAVLFISFIFALLSMLGADGAELGGDADMDMGLISISPFMLAAFGSTFGLIGLITRLYFDMEALPSLVWATGIGLIFGIAAQAFFIYVLSPSKSSHYSLQDDAVGRQAEVIVTIPADGLGTIAYDNVSGRVTLGARSSNGQEIPRGKLIQIERVTGRVAVVGIAE